MSHEPILLAAFLCVVALPAAAMERNQPPMPEPLITESITDIDGIEAGELELDVTGLLLRAPSAGSTAWAASLEVEWRATDRLGLALESALGLENGTSETGSLLDVRAGISYVLLHDLAYDFHLQLEGKVRVLGDTPETVAGVDPGEPLMRTAFGLRVGWRTGAWTLRAGMGAQAFGDSAHALPVWATLAGLVGLGPGGRFGFAGVDVASDWARRAPITVAPTVVAYVGPRFAAPLRFGLAFPWSPGGGGLPSSFAALLRVMYDASVD